MAIILECDWKLVEDRMNKSDSTDVLDSTYFMSFYAIMHDMAILLAARKLVEDQVNDSQERMNTSDCTPEHNLLHDCVNYAGDGHFAGK